MIKRLPDTLPDATCADPATPTARGRDGDHAERWQAGGDGQVRTGPVDDEPPTFDLSTAGGIARYVRHLAREAVAAEVARSPVSMRDAQPEPAQVADPGEDTEAVRRFLEGEGTDDIYPALRLGPSEVEAQIREALFDARVRARALEADVARRQESTDEQICAAEARTRAREYEADVDALSAEVERLQAEVDRLSGRAAASELARLSREAREVRQALDMSDATHDAVVAAIAGMRREGADLLAREAALRMAAVRQTGWECPTTYEGVRAQVRLMDDLREQGKAAVTDLRRWHDLLRADLGAVLRALGVPDAIEHVGTPHFEGALARASDAARALEAAAPARDLAAAVRDFVGGVSYPDRPGEREAALVAELAKIDDALAEVRQALQVAPGGLDPEARADDPAGLLRAAARRLRSLAECPGPDDSSGGQPQPKAASEATTPPGDLVRAYDADTSPGDDAWDALLCWEARGCEVRAWPEDKPIHQKRRDLGGKVVELRRQQDGREVVYVRSDVPRSPEQATALDRVDDEPAPLPACAGDEIDAREVRPGSVVLHEPTDCFGNTVSVRLAGGNGWHCDADPPADGWDWDQCGFDRCREIATALTAKECAEVAALDAAGAVAWCGARAARLATEAVGEELPRIVGWSDLRPGDLAWDGFAPAGCRALLARLSQEHHAWICEDGRVEVDHGRPCSAYGEECVLVARGMSDNPHKVLEPARAAWAAVREVAEALPEIREAHARSAELAARAQAFDAARALPRVVEWADLQPGDLAWDAGDREVAPLLRVGRGGKATGAPASWRLSDGSEWHATTLAAVAEGTQVATRAILLARGVPKRASAIRAAWEAVRPQAERLAEQARKEGT